MPIKVLYKIHKSRMAQGGVRVQNLGQLCKVHLCCIDLEVNVQTKKIMLKLVFVLNRGSYMSAHVLLNLLNMLGKQDQM